jgi:hypothetical protein
MKRSIRVWIIACIAALGLLAAPAKADTSSLQPGVIGGLDCNGYSPIQKTLLAPKACTDVRGFAGVDNANTWGGHFYDNGYYIGHDEPNIGFFSSSPGSGNNVGWTETLPVDPTALPTVGTPGSDVTHYFELSIAPWFGMDLCDASSYPQLPCTPNSDANAPDSCTLSANPCSNGYAGGGSAFLEMQFYPPGEGPFVENISCDNTHWCASLHINELECTYQFATCNNNCEETTNFAFVQRDGIPTGPPSPQLGNLATSTPNSETLLMNPGDKLSMHIWDAPVPGGAPNEKALEVSINDLTTGQTGYMQASAANGFARTSIANCDGQYFDFEPEYATAKQQNIVPWAALQANISSDVEIGHFTPCTSVSGSLGPGIGGPSDLSYSTCVGPYESASSDLSYEDLPCFPAGDTHGTLASDPNEVTGCLNLAVGDIDFDGTPYWADWPTATSATAKNPSSFVQSLPVSNGHGYSQLLFQTDTALSESTCTSSGSGCAVPPPGAPGNFYPYWSLTKSQGQCTIEFGNVSTGAGVNNFGGDAQYGTDQIARIGYPEFEGKAQGVNCSK